MEMLPRQSHCCCTTGQLELVKEVLFDIIPSPETRLLAQGPWLGVWVRTYMYAYACQCFSTIAGISPTGSPPEGDSSGLVMDRPVVRLIGLTGEGQRSAVLPQRAGCFGDLMKWGQVFPSDPWHEWRTSSPDGGGHYGLGTTAQAHDELEVRRRRRRARGLRARVSVAACCATVTCRPLTAGGHPIQRPKATERLGWRPVEPAFKDRWWWGRAVPPAWTRGSAEVWWQAFFENFRGATVPQGSSRPKQSCVKCSHKEWNAVGHGSCF